MVNLNSYLPSLFNAVLAALSLLVFILLYFPFHSQFPEVSQAVFVITVVDFLFFFVLFCFVLFFYYSCLVFHFGEQRTRIQANK